MKLGIDIDDVLVDTSKLMLDYIKNINNNEDILNHMEEIMRGEIPDNIVSKFINSSIANILDNVQLKPNAKKVLEKLEKNNEIVFITSRGDKKIKGTEEVTLNYLKKNNIAYKKIIFNAYNKAKICKENNIDILIDDSVKLCEEAQKEGIKTILFTSIVNKNKQTNIKRVNNWLELEKII